MPLTTQAMRRGSRRSREMRGKSNDGGPPMGRQSRTKNERRANSTEEGWVAFSPNLTCQVMGKAKLAMRRTDVDAIEKMVSSASPAAHAYFAAWDSTGVGVTMDTAPYDIAYVSARTISDLRATNPSARTVMATIDVLLGDWEVTMVVVQVCRGEDVMAQIVETHRHIWDENEEGMSAFLVELTKKGVPIISFARDGTMIDIGRLGSTANF
jgi:hypothetical protein